MIPLENEVDFTPTSGSFLCGVVEGFYGRPWTTKQRSKLFERMKKMGMNTYLYAPKDDCKHRVYWRDLYSVEEADHLTRLIQSATEHDVNFMYALSPGLDMNYSNSKEVNFLKKKLEQVASFGCKSFALLFDDIDVEMCESDKEIFQSFAHAQVSVTNEIYQHLEQPSSFLFCPTEYCASRAMPTVVQSEYLNTIGSKLLPGIDIMWTGAKVITKDITVDSIKEISKVLQRPPVIWDNIHANDYDQKRLFLGPYDGRSPELIPYLKGVMTNPNCEFESNFVAMHTLAQWSKSNMEEVKKDVILSSSPVSSDIKLETLGDNTADASTPIHGYQPRVALKTALDDWIHEFFDDCDAPTKKVAKAPPPCVIPSVQLVPGNVPALINSLSHESAPAIPLAVAASLGVDNINELNGLESFMQPAIGIPVNSLIDPPSSDSETESVHSATEPMDCVITPSSSPVISDQFISEAGTCECGDFSNAEEVVDSEMTVEDPHGRDTLTSDELSLLVDMFYMPFEHGSQGLQMLLDFNDLKTNSHLVTYAKDAGPEHIAAAEEWHKRAAKFYDDIARYQSVMNHLCAIPNKAILSDLYPYAWDMKVSLGLAQTYLQWLAMGHVPLISVQNMPGSLFTCANQQYKDAFSSGEQESWVFRGGLQCEFQRLLPVEAVLDLTVPAVPVIPVPHMHTIRPYHHLDEKAVYEVCRKTCDDGADGTDIFPFHPDLVADKFVGAYVNNSPEYCFVIEDSQGVCGYALASLDAKIHQNKKEMSWLPSMQAKYPKPENSANMSPAEEMITSFHNEKTYDGEVLHQRFPSLVRVDFLPDRCTIDVAKHLLACTVAALKTNGSHGIYSEVPIGDRNTVERYGALYMFEVPPTEQPEDYCLVSRAV